MTKVIVTTIKGKPFLIETDDTIDLSADLLSKHHTLKETESDFSDVVDVEKISKEFSGLKEIIVACCDSLHDAFKSIPKPEKYTIEFGIKLAGELGIPMLTKSSAEANFKINIEWKG
ncbi:CU044_2847 family protein [Mucilaginibacter sp. AW1-3]